jgi:hypothetical protein
MPAPWSKLVEVVGVSIATEASTGETLYQVTFADRTEVTPQLRPYVPSPPGTMPPKEVAFNVIIMFFRFDTEVPYRVGSKWQLTVGADGRITVEHAGG